MNPNQAAEVTEVQKLNAEVSVSKDSSPSSRFEKARGKFFSLSSGIKRVFADLKDKSPHVALDSEQKDMAILSEQLNNLGKNTESALQKSEIPQHTETDALATPNPEQEKKSFQRDMTDLLLSSSSGTPNLGLFLSRYPQYEKYSLEDLVRNIPAYVKLSLNRSRPMDSVIDVSLKSFNKFLYRGEHGNNLSVEKNILTLIELADKQGGIGGTAENLTHVSPNPYVSLDFAIWDGVSPDGFGIWIIDAKIPKELKVVNTNDREKVIRGMVPLKYVNKLFVTKDMEEKILQKYGAENTQLFGKSIKDVIIGIDPILERPPASNAINPNQINSLIETIYKLNLQSSA